MIVRRHDFSVLEESLATRYLNRVSALWVVGAGAASTTLWKTCSAADWRLCVEASGGYGKSLGVSWVYRHSLSVMSSESCVWVVMVGHG